MGPHGPRQTEPADCGRHQPRAARPPVGNERSHLERAQGAAWRETAGGLRPLLWGARGARGARRPQGADLPLRRLRRDDQPCQCRRSRGPRLLLDTPCQGGVRQRQRQEDTARPRH